MVKNSDFPSMQNWEREFIAQLCLKMPGGKLGRNELQPLGKDKKRHEAFIKILAMARVISALDLGPNSTPLLKRTMIGKKLVKLSFSGRAMAGMEQLMIERKKKLFEELFGRELLVERYSRIRN